jgi:NCS1 family nucleobase:cation symporter-1
MATSFDLDTAPPTAAGGVEANGINVIAESERTGRTRSLLWPWAAANISVLAIGYGTYLLGLGVDFWQALIAGAIGVVVSFVLVGLVSLAGKRGSAPTMVLSRAPFGIVGNALPALVGYALTVGWEVILVTLSTQAVQTVFGRLGWPTGTPTTLACFVVVVAIIVGAGIFGYRAIISLQQALTVILGLLTVGFVLLTIKDVHWSRVSSVHPGTTQAVIGAAVLAATLFGIGWVNTGADYSRYLPRRASSAGVVWWTTFGSSVFPIVLIAWGLLLVGGNAKLTSSVENAPVAALAALLPTWYLVPFVIVAVFGLVAGAVMDIYSSGLTLLTLGVKIPRWSAALVDGVIMIAGSYYLVFRSSSFQGDFEGFLVALAVPMAAWCGVFLADLLQRRQSYSDYELYNARGRYGVASGPALIGMLLGMAAGFGLVVSYVRALTWEGYLLGPLGLGGKTGVWADASLGVVAALVVGLVVQLLFGLGRVRRQERTV